MGTSALCGQLICFSCMALRCISSLLFDGSKFLSWSNCLTAANPYQDGDRSRYFLYWERRGSEAYECNKKSSRRLLKTTTWCWSRYTRRSVCRWCFSVHLWWTVVCRLPVGTKDRNDNEYSRERERERKREREREREGETENNLEWLKWYNWVGGDKGWK